VSPSAFVRRPVLTSQTLAEQFGPIVAVHASVINRGDASVDVREARARIRAGRHAFDAATLLRSADDLNRSFHRIAAAFERTGVESSARLTDLRGRTLSVTTMMVAWSNGDSVPRDPVMRFARIVAGVVANAVLSSAASSVTKGFPLTAWKRTQCPCCGASPDLVIVTEKRRTLICWRCDTTWRTDIAGCLGCGEDSPPTLFRVPSPYQGYELAVCNSCGRYVKERRGGPSQALLVERALTIGLDEAAQLRGLRT
jgi:formate dehydrogenase maturation protein FdhE